MAKRLLLRPHTAQHSIAKAKRQWEMHCLCRTYFLLWRHEMGANSVKWKVAVSKMTSGSFSSFIPRKIFPALALACWVLPAACVMLRLFGARNSAPTRKFGHNKLMSRGACYITSGLACQKKSFIFDPFSDECLVFFSLLLLLLGMSQVPWNTDT